MQIMRKFHVSSKSIGSDWNIRKNLPVPRYRYIFEKVPSVTVQKNTAVLSNSVKSLFITILEADKNQLFKLAVE